MFCRPGRLYQERGSTRLYNQILDGPSKGAKITSLEDIPDGYYEAMQWDIKTCLPTTAKLKQLGLDFAKVLNP